MDSLIEEDPELATKYYGTYKRIRLETGIPAVDLEGEPVFMWLHGDTGTGKSHLARRLYPDAYFKPAATKWWDGYNGEETVIIDDLDEDHKYQGFNLKIW